MGFSKGTDSMGENHVPLPDRGQKQQNPLAGITKGGLVQPFVAVFFPFCAIVDFSQRPPPEVAVAAAEEAAVTSYAV
ncbi:hypothetical protein IFR05_011053 [Cadophora sp. M221]|nr:hypothetical protein IFR05_011053 [Cadophora sp. M221]